MRTVVARANLLQDENTDTYDVAAYEINRRIGRATSGIIFQQRSREGNGTGMRTHLLHHAFHRSRMVSSSPPRNINTTTICKTCQQVAGEGGRRYRPLSTTVNTTSKVAEIYIECHSRQNVSFAPFDSVLSRHRLVEDQRYQARGAQTLSNTPDVSATPTFSEIPEEDVIDLKRCLR